MERAAPGTLLARALRHVDIENTHDIDAVLATFGEYPTFDDAPWADRREGAAGVRSQYMDLLRAAPDIHVEVEQAVEGDETVLSIVRITGTHLGAWRGLPATGRRFDVRVCIVFSFDAAGLITAERSYYDRATVLRQLGVFFEPETTRGKLFTALLHPVTMLRAAGRALRGAPLGGAS